MREACDALRDKLFEDMDEDDRIEAFVAEHVENELYTNTSMFDWHNRLTGSCLAGRKAFVKDHGIDMDGSMTVAEFIRLTENAYGGDVIQRLKERYNL